MHIESSTRSKLLDALEQSDRDSRLQRSERIVWLSQYNSRPGVTVGPSDTMAILSEADACFISGNWIAVVFLATAFIEHSVFDELHDRSLAKFGVRFSDALRIAKDHKVFDEDTLNEIHELVSIRNPYAHRKGPEHRHSLGNRYTSAKTHPMNVLEADAKEAIRLLYKILGRH